MRITIVDDHPFIISGIQTMLQLYNDVTIIDTFNTGEGLLEGLSNKLPDVLLLDLHLPDIPGSELAQKVMKQYPDLKILILTSVDQVSTVREMIKYGCKGYLLKNANPETFYDALQHVSRGKQYIDSTIKEKLLQSALEEKSNNSNNPELTRREKEILKLIIAEYTSQEIADQLFLSLRTIEHHRYSILHKMGVKNTVGLIKKAIEMGMT